MTAHVPTVEWERLGSRDVATNGITLRVVDHGEGGHDRPLVVLCHGFPELAFSWRHQVLALAEAGYRVLAPDMRGYGGSSRPEDVEAYDVLTLCAGSGGPARRRREPTRRCSWATTGARPSCGTWPGRTRSGSAPWWG